ARACCASRPAATPPTPPSSPATAPASGWARRPSPRPSTATSPPTTTPRPCRSPDGGARQGHYADPGPLAQSVEQRTFNPWVVGSGPTGPTVERRRPAKTLPLAPYRGAPPPPVWQEWGRELARPRGRPPPREGAARPATPRQGPSGFRRMFWITDHCAHRRPR